jgi:peptide/nickel transport system permease protein
MNFVARRFVHAIFLLAGISVLSFALVQLAPGDFFDELRLNPQLSTSTVEGIRSQYGLDQPFFSRFGHWILSSLRGDFGYSLAYSAPVGPLLKVRARNTLVLTGTATLLAWILALSIGIVSAASRRMLWRRITGITTSALLTIPELLLFLCLLLAAVRTGWFPAGGMVSTGFEELSVWAKVRDLSLHLFLPAMGLAIAMLPALVRHVHAAVADALRCPFMAAARAHGIPHQRLLFRYALPVAMNPLISLFGFSVGAMLSASLLAEVVLSWPGLGPLLVEATLNKDIYLVVATVVLSAAFLIGGNLLSDLLLFATDPRIRVEANP